MRSSFSLTLPGSQSRAFWTLLLFVAVQLADGALTYMGILRFGPAIEANPLLSFCAAVFGASSALVVAKSVAIIGGATLHVFSQHFVLAALTVACVFGATSATACGLGAASVLASTFGAASALASGLAAAFFEGLAPPEEVPEEDVE